MANWKDIRDRRVAGDQDREQRIRRERMLLDMEVALHQLRERRGVSQQTLAQHLGTSQPNVSRIEREEDIYLSTLDRYVSGLGGRLEVHAVFDDEDVRLTPA